MLIGWFNEHVSIAHQILIWMFACVLFWGLVGAVKAKTPVELAKWLAVGGGITFLAGTAIRLSWYLLGAVTYALQPAN